MPSLFDAIGNGLKGLFGDGFPERAAMAQAILNENPEAAARIAGERTKRKQAAEAQQRLVGALRQKGLSDADVEIVLANPEKFSEYYGQRFGTANVDEGSSRVTGNLDGTQSVFTAPKTFQEGADVVQTLPRIMSVPTPGAASPMSLFSSSDAPPSANANPNFVVNGPGMGVQASRVQGLRTEAEQYADSLAERGTREWGSAVKDYVLKANGPTANAHDADIWGKRLNQSNTNNIRTTGTSAANSQRTTAVSRENNIRSTNVSRDNNRDSNRTRLQTSPRARGNAVRVKSIEEARRLPPGTLFETPDGQLKVR